MQAVWLRVGALAVLQFAPSLQLPPEAPVYPAAPSAQDADASAGAVSRASVHASTSAGSRKEGEQAATENLSLNVSRIRGIRHVLIALPPWPPPGPST